METEIENLKSEHGKEIEEIRKAQHDEEIKKMR